MSPRLVFPTRTELWEHRACPLVLPAPEHPCALRLVLLCDRRSMPTAWRFPLLCCVGRAASAPKATQAAELAKPLCRTGITRGCDPSSYAAGHIYGSNGGCLAGHVSLCWPVCTSSHSLWTEAAVRSRPSSGVKLGGSLSDCPPGLSDLPGYPVGFIGKLLKKQRKERKLLEPSALKANWPWLC